jgi:hypothetical protein
LRGKAELYSQKGKGSHGPFSKTDLSIDPIGFTKLGLTSEQHAAQELSKRARIAEAGAAGAVVAGSIERARSRSRNGRRERSRSRIRTGLPIAAAGLGSTAIAGLYEKNKAQRQEAEALAERRRSTSRSCSPTESAYFKGLLEHAGYPNFIEYGNGPTDGKILQADYYGHGPVPQEGYYSNEMLPAAAGAGAAYTASREVPRSHSRDKEPSSSESSDGKRRRRGRRRRPIRSRDSAPALAARGSGTASTEYARRKKKKTEEAKMTRCRSRSRSRAAPAYSEAGATHNDEVDKLLGQWTNLGSDEIVQLGDM